MDQRYLRQIQFAPIGILGQEALGLARVGIIGQGALGCASADYLARAGVGFLRLLDTDRVEQSNLQRQILYTEEDLGESKVRAAATHLYKINSSIVIEALEQRLDDENAWNLLEDLDLVVDASDNFEARFAINRFCLRQEIPWIYGGVVGSQGMTMNFLPGGPCLSCVMGDRIPKRGEYPVASTHGILATLPPLMAAIQCSEAIKLLTGSGRVRTSLLSLDLWNGEQREFDIKRDPLCRCCGFFI